MPDHDIDMDRRRARPRRRWLRYLKRMLIGLSISLNILFLSSIVAGYFIYRQLFNHPVLTNAEKLEESKLHELVKNYPLLSKIFQLQENQFIFLDHISEE